LDYDHPPYQQTPQEAQSTLDEIYGHIDRFAGPQARSQWVRLHYFSEAFELADFFHQNGVHALLTTDKETLSHRMPSSVKENLARSSTAEYHQMRFVRSHIRVENYLNGESSTSEAFRRMDSLLAGPGFVTLFTHECELRHLDVRELLTRLLEYLTQAQIPSF
jgi:hypothetical protein